jgi:hypothetical protein
MAEKTGLSAAGYREDGGRREMGNKADGDPLQAGRQSASH